MQTLLTSIACFPCYRYLLSQEDNGRIPGFDVCIHLHHLLRTKHRCLVHRRNAVRRSMGSIPDFNYRLRV